MSQKKKPKNNFVLLGGMADYDRADGDCLLKNSGDDHVVWTAHKNMKPGDRAFFYITAPVSAIVAAGTVFYEPWTNENLNSRWSNYPMTEIGDLVHLPEAKRLRIGRLRKLFPDWNWLRYPRANARIPDDISFPFIELFNEQFILF